MDSDTDISDILSSLDLIISSEDLSTSLLTDIYQYQREIAMSLHCIELILIVYFFHYVISRIGKILRDI